MKQIGILGGTFDPVHLAHLILAERARDELVLDAVIFIPAAVPPHKRTRTITPGPRRWEMLEIALAGNPHFRASDIELKRPGVSYTIDTLIELEREYPDARFHLIIGADTLNDIVNWHRPAEIVRRAVLVVAGRPGTSAVSSLPYPDVEIVSLEMPHLEISSTEIRERVGEGRSIRYLVPAGVEAYIHAQDLYRESAKGDRGG